DAARPDTAPARSRASRDRRGRNAASRRHLAGPRAAVPLLAAVRHELRGTPRPGLAPPRARLDRSAVGADAAVRQPCSADPDDGDLDRRAAVAVVGRARGDAARPAAPAADDA